MSRRYSGPEKPRRRGGRNRSRPVEHKDSAGARETDPRRAAAAAVRDLLQGSRRGFKSRSLYNRMGRPLEYREFRALLGEMQSEGRLTRDELRRWVIPSNRPALSGTLIVQKSGNGFLLPDDGSDRVFIHRKHLDRYLQDDRIEAELVAGRGGPSREARPLKLIERQLQYVVGRLARYSRSWVLLPESARFGGSVVINGELPEGAEDGDMVRARLIRPDEAGASRTIAARVTRILGRPGTPVVLQETVKASFNLPEDFRPAVLAEVEALHEGMIAPQEGREDLRDTFCMTIDPPDARDFDDAVSIRPLEDGGWELGVHIADVSHFVEEDGPLDREAMRRGCSVYLVGEVVPMLPHRLSSDLCSLVEGEDRCCFTALMRFSASGVMRSARFTPSLIHSRRRFAYEQVQQILEQFPKRRPAGFDPEVTYGEEPDRLALYHMDRLWRILKRRRLKKGGLDFALPEPVFDRDADGRPTAIHAKTSREANFLIEEFMLAANQAVAQALSKAERACPFRVHEAPSGEKLSRFHEFIEHLGLEDLPDLSHVSGWQQVIRQAEESGKGLLLQEMVLRSMMKARYDLKELGHFGLGFQTYAHFTSPIRRYPDLLVHRQLKSLLAGGKDRREAALGAAILQSNRREILAQEAERDSVRLHQILYLRQFLGESFRGVVRGVERFGVFVELPDLLCDGLLPVEELPDDRWHYDARRWELVGLNSGTVLATGTELDVTVLRADLEDRQVDFALAEAPERKATAPHRGRRRPGTGSPR